MKKFLLVAFVMFFSFYSMAQPKKGYLYLKNGTILKGKLAGSENPQKIKFESAGNTWVFDRAEVDTITASRKESRVIDQKQPVTRFSNLTELGLLIGNSGNSQSAPFSFNSFLNYRLNTHFIVGAGTGVEFFKETYLPGLASVQYKFRDSRSTPYLFFEGGYLIPVEDSRQVYYDLLPANSTLYRIYPYPQNNEMKAKGGMVLNPGIGYRHMLSPNFGMSLSFGYRFNRLNYSGEKDYELDIDYNRLSVKLGIIFN